MRTLHALPLLLVTLTGLGFGQDADSLLADLTADHARRQEAVRTLENNPKLRAQGISALVQAARHTNENVCGYALGALARLYPKAPETMPTLLAATEDDRWFVRISAVAGINRLYKLPSAAAAVPALTRLVESDPNPGVRGNSVGNLTLMGARAASSAEALARVLRSDSEGMVRNGCANALGRLGVRSATIERSLLAALEDDTEVGARANAARSLGRLGLNPSVSCPALIRALHDAHGDVRRAALQALVAFGAPAEAALVSMLGARLGGDQAPDLAQALQSERSEVRELALVILAVRGAAREEELEQIARRLGDELPSLRILAASTLSRVAPPSAAVPLLLGLRDAPGELGASARAGLTRLGRRARKQGTDMAWVLPRAYAPELLAVLALLLLWFAALYRFPRQRPRSKWLLLGLVAGGSLAPAIALYAAAYQVWTQTWVKPFLPTLEALPWGNALGLPSGILVTSSGCFCLLLASTWVCLRKPQTPLGDRQGTALDG